MKLAKYETYKDFLNRFITMNPSSILEEDTSNTHSVKKQQIITQLREEILKIIKST